MYNPYVAFYSLQNALLEKQAQRTTRPIDAIYKMAQGVNSGQGFMGGFLNAFPRGLGAVNQYMQNWGTGFPPTTLAAGSDTTQTTMPDTTQTTMPDTTQTTGPGLSSPASDFYSALRERASSNPNNVYNRRNEAYEALGIPSPYVSGGHTGG